MEDAGLIFEDYLTVREAVVSLDSDVAYMRVEELEELKKKNMCGWIDLRLEI